MTTAAQRRSLEEAIVDTVREPLIVLDDALRVVVASRSFYRAFEVTPQETEGRTLYELGNGQWNIPALRKLLDEIIPHHTTIEEYEVEHDFPTIGRRTMLLNARKVFYEGNNSTSLSGGDRRCHRPPRTGTREGRIAAAEGSSAARNESPNQQQPANYCEHPAAESADSPIRRDTPTPPRRA